MAITEYSTAVKGQIVRILIGTSDSITGTIEEIAPDIIEEEIEDIMYEARCDRCSRCGTWMHQYELQDDPNDVSLYICGSCAE